MTVLKALRGGRDYGLPVGGPGSRLLAEVALAEADRTLLDHNVDFVRFVDDYRIFSDTESAAHADLARLATVLEKLGLTLSKAKTKIQSADVFLERESGAVDALSEWRKVRRDRLRAMTLDEYETGEDIQRAKTQALQNVDVLELLTAALRSDHPEPGSVKMLVGAIPSLDTGRCTAAVNMILDNLPVLLPVMPAVLRALRECQKQVGHGCEMRIRQTIREAVASGSHVVGSSPNLGFSIRLLGDVFSEQTQATLAGVFRSTSSSSVRRDIILALAGFGAGHWLLSVASDISSLGPWERRALLIAAPSFDLSGARWRRVLLKRASPYDRMVARWASAHSVESCWFIPL